MLGGGPSDTPDAHADVASLRTLVDGYERGEFDIAAVGRAALANPDFVNKIRAGRHDELTHYSQRQHKRTLH